MDLKSASQPVTQLLRVEVGLIEPVVERVTRRRQRLGVYAVALDLLPSLDDVLDDREAVGWALYLDYFLPFEIASVFLLVAMIGAVVLGKRTMEKVD